MDYYSVNIVKHEHDYEDNPDSNEVLGSTVLQYIQNMYDDFKRCIESKNSDRADKIIKNIANVDPDSNILNLLEGALYFLHGDGVNAHKFLLRYAKNARTIDVWALNYMAMWNLITGHCKLAYKQFTKVMQGCSDTRFADTSFVETKTVDAKFIFSVLINAAKAKKKMGFYDRALEYLERISRLPDGYRMILVVKLEIIHIYILKQQYDKALEEIEIYSKESENLFLKRLKVLVLYLKKSFKEMSKFKRDEERDPYILYVLARAGLENPKFFNIDVSYCLDEAIKNTHNNEYFYNTYGNYYYMSNRFSDAAEQYNNALSLNPMFEPALSNLKLFVKASSRAQEDIYITRPEESNRFSIHDVCPDIEKLGFLDTWVLFNFTPFKADYFFLQKAPSLKYYFSYE